MPFIIIPVSEKGFLMGISCVYKWFLAVTWNALLKNSRV